MDSRALITVSGMVQGVGFRYYALRQARLYGLSGYVKNLPNGNVESEVEGPSELIKEYIKALRVGPAFSRVTAVDVEWKPFQGKYNEFTITG